MDKRAKIGEAATWSEAILGPQRALMESAMYVQEQNMKLAWGLIEQYQRQWEALQALTRESVGACVDLFYAPMPNSRAKPEADGSGRGLPIEDYDLLSVEETTMAPPQ